MFYDFPITVPALRAEDDPVEEELKLTHGVIHRVEVRFRRGTDFRVGLRIYRWEHQLYPTNPDSDFKDDGRAIVFDDHYRLTVEPYSLKVRAYAPTATYPHVVYVRIGVLPPELLTPFAGFASMFKKLFRLLGIGR